MRTALLLFFSLAFAASTALAQPRSVYVEDLTWPEIRDAIGAGKTTAIIYVGSTEQMVHTWRSGSTISLPIMRPGA